MNKAIIISISIVVILGAIFTGIVIINSGKKDIIQEETRTAEEEILDDCTDEYEMMQQKIITTNSEEQRTTPNCSLIIKTYFTKCGHITSEYLNLPEDNVNLNKEEIQEKYPDYKVQSFTNNEVVLYREKDEECGEHYLVKDNNGVVTIYKILESGSMEKIEETSISTEYLPKSDRINIENGIKINGKQDLNRLIEDFE